MADNQLRSQGQEIQAAEKTARLLQKDIGEITSRMNDDLLRASERGRDQAYMNALRARYAARLAAKQEQLQQERVRLESFYASKEAAGVDVDKARQAAPKHYVSERAQSDLPPLNPVGLPRGGPTGVRVSQDVVQTRSGRYEVTGGTRPGVYGSARNPVIVQGGRSSTNAKVRALSDNNQSFSDPLYDARAEAVRSRDERRAANRPIGQRNDGSYIYQADFQDTKRELRQINYINPEASTASYGRIRTGREVSSSPPMGDRDLSRVPFLQESAAGAYGAFQEVFADAKTVTGPVTLIHAADSTGSKALRYFSEVFYPKNRNLLPPFLQSGASYVDATYKTGKVLQGSGKFLQQFNIKGKAAIFEMNRRQGGNIFFENSYTVVAKPYDFTAGAIKRSGNLIVNKPVTTSANIIGAKYAGKVFGFADESLTYFSSRYAASTAAENILLRTSTAGLFKGVQATPAVIGGALVYQEVKGKNAYELGETTAEIAPAGIGFTSGVLSVKGAATNWINKAYVRLGGAKFIPAQSLAEQSVIDFYEIGPTAPGAKKFSVITPAGDLAANKAAFEKATFLSPTYTQRVSLTPVQNAVREVSPFLVPRNPDLVLRRRILTGFSKNYDVVTASQARFAQRTAVLRGTSRQGGLYVAPTGQAQLYFLGLGKEESYNLAFGGFSSPNLVRIRNIKGYSEDLIPLLRREGQGTARLSDVFLREQAKPKTAYLESRTYYGETPEVQAVIPEGTPLVQKGLRGRMQEFFGYNKYTIVDDTVIPVQQFTALKKPGTKSVSTDVVRKITDDSASYSRYKKSIDPARSGVSSSYSVQYESVRTPVLSYSGSGSRSRQAVSVGSTTSSTSHISRILRTSYAPPSYARSSTGSSITPYRYSRSSTDSSTAPRYSGSSSVKASRSGSSIVARPSPPESIRQRFDLDLPKRKKPVKKVRERVVSRLDRLFAYTPTLAGTESVTLEPQSSFTTGLNVRPVFSTKNVKKVLYGR